MRRRGAIAVIAGICLIFSGCADGDSGIAPGDVASVEVTADRECGFVEFNFDGLEFRSASGLVSIPSVQPFEGTLTIKKVLDTHVQGTLEISDSREAIPVAASTGNYFRTSTCQPGPEG